MEFHSCQQNVRDFSQNQEKVEKQLVRKKCPKTFLEITSTGFFVSFTVTLFINAVYCWMLFNYISVFKIYIYVIF